MSYGLYIGKNLTSDGHAWLAGYGDEPSSHWLEIIPKIKHKKGKKIIVGVSENSDMPGKLIKIPQISKTNKHIRVSYSYYLGVPAPITNVFILVFNFKLHWPSANLFSALNGTKTVR